MQTTSKPPMNGHATPMPDPPGSPLATAADLARAGRFHEARGP